MLKKLSILLALATLCTSMGVVAPVSAQAAVEETVLVETDFQSCKPGTYTAANQMDGDVDLRNGLITSKEALTEGYTVKNGTVYEPISEADIVTDTIDGKPTKVLRLNSFLDGGKDMTLQTNANLPNSGKVKIDLEMKMTYPSSFYMYHSSSTLGGGRRLWRMERASGSEVDIFLQEKITTGFRFPYNYYNKFTAVIDTETAEMSFFKNDEFIKTITGWKPANPWQLYLVQARHNDVVPALTLNAEDNSKIESIENPQYVYIKSFKVTTYTDTALESVTPNTASSIMTPTEAVFTFNKEIKKVEAASVYSWKSGETVDVTESLIYDGKTVKVPYAFEDDCDYTVSLEGATDGITSTTAETEFTTESWNASNLTENPVNSSFEDNNEYLIKEDFTNSTGDSRETMILPEHTSKGWFFDAPATKGTASIVDLGDGNKAFQVSVEGAETITQISSSTSKTLDDTTILSFDMFIEEGTTRFTIARQVAGGRIDLANWFKGTWNNTKTMSAGEWHKVELAVSNTGASLYVDGNFVVRTTATEAQKLADTKFIRFTTNSGTVKIDNLKLYLDKNPTVLTAAAPTFGGTAKASAPLEFTFNETIGDATNAQLIVKKDGTTSTLTNGNGMSVKLENSKVKLILDNALDTDCAYAVELSGLKDIKGGAVSAVRTKFTAVADDEWTLADITDTLSSTEANVKSYSVKIKHQGDAKNAQLVVATYKADGSLSTVVFSEEKSVGEEWTELTIDRAEFFQAKSTKLFIWDSAEGMTPIFDAISK